MFLSCEHELETGLELWSDCPNSWLLSEQKHPMTDAHLMHVEITKNRFVGVN